VEFDVLNKKIKAVLIKFNGHGFFCTSKKFTDTHSISCLPNVSLSFGRSVSVNFVVNKDKWKLTGRWLNPLWFRSKIDNNLNVRIALLWTLLSRTRWWRRPILILNYVRCRQRLTFGDIWWHVVFKISETNTLILLSRPSRSIRSRVDSSVLCIKPRCYNIILFKHLSIQTRICANGKAKLSISTSQVYRSKCSLHSHDYPFRILAWPPPPSHFQDLFKTWERFYDSLNDLNLQNVLLKYSNSLQWKGL